MTGFLLSRAIAGWIPTYSFKQALLALGFLPPLIGLVGGRFLEIAIQQDAVARFSGKMVASREWDRPGFRGDWYRVWKQYPRLAGIVVVGHRDSRAFPPHDAVANLGKISTLQGLRMENLRLTDADLRTMLAMRNLKRLELVNCQLPDEEIWDIGNLVGLETLVLTSTDVGDETVARIAGLPSLRWVDLRNTRTSPRGVEMLRELPHLSASTPHGCFDCQAVAQAR